MFYCFIMYNRFEVALSGFKWSQVLQYYGVIALRSAALVGFSITYSQEV